MKTIAAVDIGTNSVKLTVGRREDDGRVRVLYDGTQITRLGKNVDSAGRLDPAAVERTLAALTTFRETARVHGAEAVFAVGTSALRDAADGAAFVEQAERVLGGTVEIIAGEREAFLTYLAARRDPDLAIPDEAVLAATDIGGGSTEVVLGRGDRLLYTDSLQLGAVRLTERTAPGDPWTEGDLARAAEAADEILLAVPIAEEAITLVASGGTAANLAGLHLGHLDPATAHGVRLTRAELEAILQRLANLPLAERRRVPGLEPDRADVIVAGALIQIRLMKRLAVGELIVSARGLRFGLLYERLAAER